MKRFVPICLFVFFLLSLVYGDMTFAYTKDALLIWFEKLVPSLFISMVLVRVLYDQRMFQLIMRPIHKLFQVVFRIDTNASALVLSTMLLGFPTGASIIDEDIKKGHLTSNDAKRLLYTCSFATPGFIIMSCGVVLFQSVTIGWQLLAIQIVCGLFCLLITRKDYVQFQDTFYQTPPFMTSLSKAILQSGKTLYMIGGYLMFFMTLCSLLLTFLPESIALPIRISAEFSSGIILIAQNFWSMKLKLVLISMLLGFGGFCVHIQVMSMVENSDISYYRYLSWRIFQMLLCGICAFLIF